MEPTTKQINEKITELADELCYAWWNDLDLDLGELSWLEYWTEAMLELETRRD